MHKKIIIILFVLLVFALTACETTETPDETPNETIETQPPLVLTEIIISGVQEAFITYEAPFNVFTGVIAMGDDGIDYSEHITITTIASVDDEGNLDTTQIGKFAVRYNLIIGEISLQKLRFITVIEPTRPEGLLVNGNFELGTVFWDDAVNGFFVADGAEMTLSIEEGALKVVLIAGTNIWTPRFGQQNIPFEEGKTYTVSFRAKSSETKTINLQVGELLSGEPWFRDFKPNQTEHRTITTEWATYSYTFTMTLDNQNGGILFELGNVPPEGRVNATMWFDDIEIIEVGTED